MKNNKKISIPSEVYDTAEKIFREYADICKSLHISSPTHLISLITFLKIIHLKKEMENPESEYYTGTRKQSSVNSANSKG